MYIERFTCRENNAPGDWIVKGEIYIKGEFTREEWEKIKSTFIAMGLFQKSHGRRPSETTPSRADVVEHIMRIAGNRQGEALFRCPAEKQKLPQPSGDPAQRLLKGGGK
jgi:hypothetical protein